jgi:hypothetical protein
MDACVRSNLYDEALSIAGLANTLERRDAAVTATTVNTDTPNNQNLSSIANTNNHNSSNLIVQQVVDQIRQRQGDLQQQLWQRLSQASVTLPDCLEVVTALRRLNAIELERQKKKKGGGLRRQQQQLVDLEALHARMQVQLQMDFLQARDVWLDAPTTVTTAAIHAASAPEDLLDTIERYRTRVFEIATQFNAIFRTKEESPTDTDTGAGGHTSQIVSAVSLLRLWMSRRIEGLLQILAQQVPQLPDTSAVRDALEAALFCATSLGRLGADFTARLPPIFTPTVVQRVTTAWRDGAQQLQETLDTCRQAGVATPLTAVVALPVAAANRAAAPDDADGDTLLADMLRPPRRLLETPPLARWVNALLTGLNELRRCLLPSAVYPLHVALQQVLDDVQGTLRQFERAVHVPGFGTGAAPLRRAAQLYQNLWTATVVPYAWASLAAAVGDVPTAQGHWAVVQASLEPPVEEKEEQAETKETSEEEPTKDTETEPSSFPTAAPMDNAEEEPGHPEEEEAVPAPSDAAGGTGTDMDDPTP